MSTERVGTAIGGHADKEKQASTVCTMDLLLLNWVQRCSPTFYSYSNFSLLDSMNHEPKMCFFLHKNLGNPEMGIYGLCRRVCRQLRPRLLPRGLPDLSGLWSSRCTSENWELVERLLKLVPKLCLREWALEENPWERVLWGLVRQPRGWGLEEDQWEAVRHPRK